MLQALTMNIIFNKYLDILTILCHILDYRNTWINT